MRGLIIVRDAVIVTAASFAVALVYNAVQPSGIPLVAKEPYRILVPCPVEGKGEVHPVAAADVRWGQAEVDLVVDARLASEHQAWAPPGVRSVPYDFLDPISDEAVADLVSEPVERVVVLGDGLVPDCGQEMGAELAGRGVRNVHFVEGGAPAARAHLEVSP